MKHCTLCGQEIRDRRSNDISRHFHSHITQIAQETGIRREIVYFSVLLLAIEIVVDGAEPYPYVTFPRLLKSPITGTKVLHDLPEPLRTTNRTNKQMMTAVEACHLYATTEVYPAVILREKCDACKGTGILNGVSCGCCDGTGKDW